MKRALLISSICLLLLLPWGLYRVVAQPSAGPWFCRGESEFVRLSARGPIRYQGSMTYRPEPGGRALIRFEGDFDIGQGTHYHVNRTAEVLSEMHDGNMRLTTLSASTSFADDAPNDLVRRYVHPSLEAGARYDAKLFEIAEGTLASGSEISPRNLCSLQRPQSD